MGATVDPSVAKRYLDSVADPPADGSAKTRKRARGEDAFEVYLRKMSRPQKDEEVQRAAWVSMKSLSSDWYVHPTPLGPNMTNSVRMGRTGDSRYWIDLIEILCYGCFYPTAAGNPLKVTLHPEILRAIYAGAKCLEEQGVDAPAIILEIHSDLASRVEFKASNG